MSKSPLAKKGFLFQKGERVLLGLAAGLMLIFSLLGVSSMFGSDIDPEEIEKQINSKASSLRSQMASTSEEPEPLPEWVSEKLRFDHVDHEEHQLAGLFFAPSIGGTQQRINPVVVPPVEMQSELVRASIYAYEMVINEDGKVRIAVVSQARQEVQKSDTERMKDVLRGLDKRSRRAKQLRDQIKSIIAREQAGAGGFGEEGGEGGPGGFPGFPGGPGGGMPVPGMSGGEEGYPGGEGGPSYDPNQIRNELNYLSLEDVDPTQHRIGLTIFPKRMAVVYASLPYKQQLEEFRKALRLGSVEEVFATNPPFYEGFEVQRRSRPLGQEEWSEWANFDYERGYRDTIFPRMISPQPEPSELIPVLLHSDYRLAMPMPGLVAGQTFPKVELKTIKDTIEKIRKLTKPPEVPDSLKKKLSGEGDIWASGPIRGMGGEGGPGEEGDPFGFYGSPPGAGGGPGGMQFPGAGGFPGEGDGEGYGGEMSSYAYGTGAQDHVLIRFLDTDIAPGREYQYAIRVKVSNPNFGLKDQVAMPSMAEVETLYSPWAEMNGGVSLPRENYLYAVAHPKDERDKSGEGEGKVQIQTWREAVKPVGSRAEEPVGQWVVADFYARVGQYLGGQTLVKLPIWSVANSTYQLREVKDPRFKKNKDDEPKGVILDVSTGDVVVDISGGKESRKLNAIRSSSEGFSAPELLIIHSDGQLEVLDSSQGERDPDRKKRADEWKKWTSEIEKQGSAPAGGGSGLFDRD